MKLFQKVTEVLRSIAGHYRSIMEALWKRYKVMQDYGTFWNVTEALRIVTESLRNILILPITN